MANDLIDLVAEVGGPALLLLTLAIVFAESAILLDLLVPGEVGLVIAGAAAAQADVPLVAIIGAAAIGAVLGDTAGYWLGRTVGPAGARRWRWSRAHVQPRLERARAHFDRHGGVSVALARWVGALRAVVPVVAGAAGLPYPRFLAWSVPAAVAWAAVVGGIGFHFGDDAADAVDDAGRWISAVVVGALVVVWLVHRHRHRDHKDGGPRG